jgi:CheY-like chemotaxis protein
LLDSTQKGIDGIALTRAIRSWEQQEGNSAPLDTDRLSLFDR